MKRSNLMKIFIPLTLVLLFFSFALSVQATSNNSRVTYRPFHEYTDSNPRVLYGWAGFGNGHLKDTVLRIMFYLDDELYPDPSTYDGKILERELTDGRSELTVSIDLLNATVFASNVFIDGIWGPNLFEGLTMSGNLVFKFILPYPGYDIPKIWKIGTEAIPESEWVLSSITATGTGTFTEDANLLGFTPGATGRVNLIQRVPAIAEAHNPFEGFYPLELIVIYEVGK